MNKIIFADQTELEIESVSASGDSLVFAIE